MKLVTILALITLFSSLVIANDSETYEQAGLPNFLPFVGHAVPGRCVMATGSTKKHGSVLMVSFEEEGFDLAPFDAIAKREDFFDEMTYLDVLKQFPQIKKMFLEVSETADGAVIETAKGEFIYRAELRETKKYFIMRVLINGKLLKYCNYIKPKNIIL
jgi:hypothetical protein